MMKWQTLQHHLDEYLQLQVWQKIDVSENGLQIQPRFAQVQKIALAVDANLLTAKLAVQNSSGRISTPPRRRFHVRTLFP